MVEYLGDDLIPVRRRMGVRLQDNGRADAYCFGEAALSAHGLKQVPLPRWMAESANTVYPLVGPYLRGATCRHGTWC